MHGLDIDIAHIRERKPPTWFDWSNPGYRTYNTRGSNAIYGGTEVLARSNIKHVEIKIPMMYSLLITTIMVQMEGLETVTGAVYRSPCKPFVKADLDTLIGLSKSKKFIFVDDLNAKHQDYCQDMRIGISMQSPHQIVKLTIRIGRMRTLTYWTSFYTIRSYMWKMQEL